MVLISPSPSSFWIVSVYHFCVAFYRFAIVFVHLRIIFSDAFWDIYIFFTLWMVQCEWLCNATYIFARKIYNLRWFTVIYGWAKRYTQTRHKYAFKKSRQHCRAAQWFSNDCYSFQQDSYLPTHFYLHTSVVYYFPLFFPIFPMSSSLNLIWIQFFFLLPNTKCFWSQSNVIFRLLCMRHIYIYMFNVWMHHGVSCCMWGCKCGAQLSCVFFWVWCVCAIAKRKTWIIIN